MTKHTSRLNGLYAITDPRLLLSPSHDLAKVVCQAIAGGTRILQYRNKQAMPSIRFNEARLLQDLCLQHDVTFLINDDVELAREINADGVHLGQEDMPLAEARNILGEDKIIGITCHASLELAQQAQAQGADYIALGRFFPSQTKPSAPPATIDVLAMAYETLAIPIVAIGGITLTNAKPLIAHGAAMLAVSHGLFSVEDVSATAQQFSDLFRE